MTDAVKIASLELENVKRVRAVELSPAADGLTVIGGRNRQGKTSVLDAIAWALGGNKMRPDDPNREGAATPAKLRVELSNGLVVERKGKNGDLHVTDESGRKAGQQLLDEFVSQLALDLPRFLGGSDKEKATALLQTIGLDEDLARLDGQIRAAAQEREAIGREARSRRAHAEKMPHHDDAPEEPVSVADLVREQQGILARNGENQRLRMRSEELDQASVAAGQRADAASAEVARLERELAAAREALKAREREHAEAALAAETASKTAEELRDESTAEVEASIAAIEETNRLVRENQDKARANEDATAAEAEYELASGKVDDLRAQRLALLDGAPLPLPDLSVDEDCRLTYQGRSWDDLSGADQMRVATAIVRATKPGCGFVLVDKLEQMDPDTLREFGAWAESEGLQVIGTRVATDETCTVVIEDGRVAGAPETGSGSAAKDESEPKSKYGREF